jgi:polysaccharide chain length determinant protein (PEP-CTERM system associated)
MDTPRPPIHVTVEDLLDQLRGAWRFRWVALIVAWCVALLLWFGVFLIPNTYQSSAQVFVNTQTTLSEATHGLSLGDNIDSQIEQVQEALLGGPQLRKVANETNLMAGAITPEEQEAVIDELRKNITITGALDPKKSSMALFTITYKDHNLARSLQVVSHLLNNFVEGSLGGKQEGSQQALTFLKGQITDYGQRLSESEQRLAAFKKRNVGLLPGENGDYFTRLQKETDDLSKEKESYALAERRLIEIKDELRTGQRFTAGAPTAGAVNPGGALDTEDQIAQTEQKLSQMLLKYTEKYPGVIELKETLKQLEARKKAELAAAKKGDVSAATELNLAANPVYQKLEMLYNNAQINIAAMKQDMADRAQRIARLRAMMTAAPQVQAEFAQLTRNYDVTKKQYDELLQRLDSASLGQQAASTGTVKFDIVNPPTPDYKPVSPKRPLLIIGSLLLALGAGLGTAYVLQLLRPVFVSSRQLGVISGMTVLGSVGMAWVERHRAERHRNQVAYVWGAAGLLVIAIGVLALQGHISNFLTELRA